jgi:hypothetical protein
MFALKLDVQACTRLLSVAAAARRSPLFLPGARLLLHADPMLLLRHAP